MKLTEDELREVLKGIENGIKVLEDHESSPNEFIEIDKLLKQFEETKKVIYQARGM